MKTFPIAALGVTALLLLPACGDDDHRDHDGGRPKRAAVRYDAGDGAISLDGDRVVIVAGGQADKATVSADGSLTIGDTLIETGSDGQAALKAYDAAATAMKAHAMAIGRTGAEFGVDVVKDVVRGFIGDEDMRRVGDRAREGARDLVASVRDLCTRLETVLSAQQAAAAAVPAFKPYAVLEADQVRECFEEVDEEAAERSDPSADGESGGKSGAREAPAAPGEAPAEAGAT